MLQLFKGIGAQSAESAGLDKEDKESINEVLKSV
jgi:CRISPR/Cas system type I-B associated protein Csh2 (Cas7 group RAMP superfamily)